MYRKLISLLLCVSTVVTAPQQNTNITYVKQQFDLEYSPPDSKPSERESRIEKVPLTIPGNTTKEKEPIENSTKESENQAPEATSSQPTYNYSDRIYSIRTKPKKGNSTTPKSIKPSDEIIDESELKHSDSNDSGFPDTNDSDIVPAESIISDRLATNEFTGLNNETETTVSEEYVTEKYEENPTVNTEANEKTTIAPSPRPLPKLSHFGKSTLGSISQNLIANAGKRKFRSRCRCEKIWNCTKLQITVPRCPNEYFLCCS